MTTVKLYAYLANNLGDDLMVDILLKRFPKCRFYSDLYIPLENSLMENKNFICKEKLYRRYGRINHLLDIVTLRKSGRWFFSKVFQQYERTCSASIYIGGSLFMQDPFQNVAKRMQREEERITVSPRYVIGANFGPYQTEDFLQGFSEYFHNCAGVTFRDKYSFRLFSKYSHVSYAPDVVLNLDISPYMGKKQTNNVIVSIIDFSRRSELSIYTDLYEQYIADCCTEIIKNGDTPVLMSFCKAEGDEEAVQRVQERIPADVRLHVQRKFYRGNLSDALECIATAKYVIATRFHAMILAIRFHKPFYCIAYNQKILCVLDDMHCDAWIRPADLPKVSPEAMFKQFAMPVDAEIYTQQASKQFAQLEQAIVQGNLWRK